MNKIVGSIVVLCLLFLISACSENLPQQNFSGHTPSSPLNRTTQSNSFSPKASAFDAAIYAALTPQDLSWGGMMYSAWWAIDAIGALDPALVPSADNATWVASGNAIQTGQETWRCSSCHGWDYIGADGQLNDTTHPYYTGIFGIMISPGFVPQTMDNPATIFDVIDTGTLPDGRIVPDHAFGTLINNPASLYALSLFVATVSMEAMSVYPGSTVSGTPRDIIANIGSIGDQADGFDNYNRSTPNTVGAEVTRQGGCNEGCHGVDGAAIALNVADPAAPKNITAAINADPLRSLHKIRFGHPGSTPAMAGLDWYGNRGIIRRTSQVVALNILGFARDALQADHARGGRLFDNWVLELGLTPPIEQNPLMAIRAPNPNEISPEQQWLCSACHGFDYEGVAGFSNNLVDLKIVRNWDLEYLYSYLKSGRTAFIGSAIVPDIHRFGLLLPDAELWNLSEFLMEGMVDTHQYISAGLGGRGLGVGIGFDGEEIFGGTMSRVLQAPETWACVGCHTDTGSGAGSGGIVTQPPLVDVFAASWSDVNSPWRFFHRTRFGMPGLYDLDGDGTATDRMPGLTEIILSDRLDPTIPASEESNLRSLTRRSMDVLTYAQDKRIRQAPLAVQNSKNIIYQNKFR